MKKETLLSELRNHLESEHEEHGIYAARIHQTKNTVVRLLFEQLMNDSQQHANMLLAMIEFVQSGKWTSDEPVHETKLEFTRLMDSEHQMLRAYTRMMSEVNDLKMRTLLNILALDEDRHYRILQYILENFVAAEPKVRLEA
jgi:rubrerythrin